MLTLIACWLLKTLESIATPCSVNTIDKYRAPPQLEVTNCDLKLSNSSFVSSNLISQLDIAICDIKYITGTFPVPCKPPPPVSKHFGKK